MTCAPCKVAPPFFPTQPKRLAIKQDRESTQDSFGEFHPEEPETVATRWGSVEPLRGREFFQAEITQALVTHRVTMRYWKPLAPDMWFEFRGRRLNIVSVINVDEANVKHEVMCTEEQ